MKQSFVVFLLLVLAFVSGCAKEPRDYEFKLRRNGWSTEVATKEGIAQILDQTPEHIDHVETIIVANKQSSNIGFIFFFKSKNQAKKFYDFKKILGTDNEAQRIDGNVVFIAYGTQLFTDLGLK